MKILYKGLSSAFMLWIYTKLRDFYTPLTNNISTVEKMQNTNLSYTMSRYIDLGWDIGFIIAVLIIVIIFRKEIKNIKEMV